MSGVSSPRGRSSFNSGVMLTMQIKNLMMVVASQCLLAGGAMAQTCTPAGPLNDATGAINVNTCTSTDQLSSICNSSTPIGSAPDTIYSLQVAPTSNTIISVTPSGYDAYIALLQGTCSGGATCSRESDSNGVGGQETFSVAGLSPGPYFLVITSFAASGNCGSTNVIAFGTPVSLQSFSIE
ncbi:hypothetical protein ACFJIW_11785 [Tahibacter sp. UC22_41]|uniref:hypothetical protein n=1 Tax=Tahibacter sp. UC22_41 TaxID=3350178 RepID=UPI0036DCA6F9